MGHATKSGGSKGYAKPSKTDAGVAGKSVDGIPMGEQQTYKQTGNVIGLPAHGNENHSYGRTGSRKGMGSHSSHTGNPY